MAIHNRGSEWRKWDLHLHSPLTRLENKYVGMDSFVEAISKLDIAVFGITNYFCLKPNELEIIRDGLRKLNSKQTVLGNIEFRINQPNKDNELINVHVLFSESLTTDQINKAIGHLKLINTADAGGKKTVYCSDESIEEANLDFTKILIEYKDLCEHLAKHFDESQYLIACCPRGYGSLRPAPREGRGGELAAEIDKRCHLAFGEEADRIHFLNTGRYDGAPQRPVLAGSDAHEPDHLGRRFCWVKAHPTFEGLRQTLFEPEQRVSLSTESPLTTFPKPYFSRITAEGTIIPDEVLAFSNVDIPLNQGLVAIIGGRGSGKSIFLDCLYQKFHYSKTSDLGREIKASPATFAVEFTKQDGIEKALYEGETDAAVTYLHVRQEEIKEKARSPDALSDEIKRLLGIKSQETQDTLGLDMAAILQQVDDIIRWMTLQDEDGNRVNTKVFNEHIIKTNEDRIKSITSDKNKPLVEEFNKNAGKLAQIRGVQQRLIGLNAKLTQYREDLSREVTNINAVLSQYQLAIPEIDIAAQIAAINTTTGRLSQETETLNTSNTQIQTQLRKEGIEQDPIGLLDKVAGFQAAITEAKQRIEDFQNRSNELKALILRRKEISEALMEAVRNSAQSVNTAFAQIKEGRPGWDDTQTKLVQRLLDDITVSGEIVFDQSAFHKGLLNVLNGKKFRASADMSQDQKLIAKFNVIDFETFSRLLIGEQIISGDDGSTVNAEQFSRMTEYFTPRDDYSFLEYLYLPEYQQRYLRVRAVLNYKGKDPKRLSVGQRGTFLVCIKLATDPFGSTLVFDQPEDDLDNEFIVSHLVPLFKEIKQYRQLIVATHNANLVVNADAEEIIVATNNNEELSYSSGALEDTNIRESVCTILDGGKDAFVKRERKYGFSVPR